SCLFSLEVLPFRFLLCRCLCKVFEDGPDAWRQFAEPMADEEKKFAFGRVVVVYPLKEQADVRVTHEFVVAAAFAVLVSQTENHIKHFLRRRFRLVVNWGVSCARRFHVGGVHRHSCLLYWWPPCGTHSRTHAILQRSGSLAVLSWVRGGADQGDWPLIGEG